VATSHENDKEEREMTRRLGHVMVTVFLVVFATVAVASAHKSVDDSAAMNGNVSTAWLDLSLDDFIAKYATVGVLARIDAVTGSWQQPTSGIPVTDYSISVFLYLYGDTDKWPDELSISQEGGENHYDPSLPPLAVGDTYVLLLYPWEIDGELRLFIAHPIGLYRVTPSGLAECFWPVTRTGQERPRVDLEQLMNRIRSAAARQGR
jgi:hypothetical protein